jgi:signal transduction histidine kinase
MIRPEIPFKGDMVETLLSFKLVIKDTGIGIKSEDLPRLFQDFEQLDSGNSRRYEGSGFGLAFTEGFGRKSVRAWHYISGCAPQRDCGR